jgi:hypothetical protein
MSVLAVITLKGDPRRLVSEYEKMSEFDLVEQSHGPISHSWTRVEDGMVIADWWDSEEGLHSFIEKLQVETEVPDPEVQLFTVRPASQSHAGSGPKRGAPRTEPRPPAGPWVPVANGADDFDAVLDLFDV